MPWVVGVEVVPVAIAVPVAITDSIAITVAVAVAIAISASLVRRRFAEAFDTIEPHFAGIHRRTGVAHDALRLRRAGATGKYDHQRSRARALTYGTGGGNPAAARHRTADDGLDSTHRTTAPRSCPS
jgi:hypothetical protein